MNVRLIVRAHEGGYPRLPVTVSHSNQNSKQENRLVVSLLSEGAHGREEILSDLGQGRRNFLQQDPFKTLDAKFTALRIEGLNDSV
jgi:hypothetical protein